MSWQESEMHHGPSTTVVVSAAATLKGTSLVASALAAFLRQYAEVEVLLIQGRSASNATGDRARVIALSDAERLPADQIKAAIRTCQDSDPALDVAIESQSSERVAAAFERLLAKLEPTFPFIVIDVGDHCMTRNTWIRAVADVSVEIVENADPGEDRSAPDSPRIYRVVNLFNPASAPIPISHCEPFVVPRDDGLPAEPGDAQCAYLRANRRAPASPPLRRLARKILGMSLGLAIGGGAAFGVAHVGLLKVFDDNDIPIDLIAGTSMGSIIAVGHAVGISPGEMLDISDRLGTKATTLSALDFTLARSGLLSGNRAIAIFSPNLGSTQRFEELRFPCRVVATDIETGERVIIADGSLIDACRASCSVPVIWVPAQRGERTLVDGALVDPVPAAVVREMGADICIAVNAVPGPKKGVTNALTKLWRRGTARRGLFDLGKSLRTPNSMDIFMNTMRIMQHELGKFRAAPADLTITPDLADFTWVEFYKTKQLIERGTEAAERALPEIRRLLAERRTRAVMASHPAAEDEAG